jgi:adenylate kinase
MALNVIMLGAPGAGKGTQAERFARQHGLPKISTGDILRQGIKDNLPVAMIAKAKMDRGELVDDETMVAIARDRLKRPDTSGGFVLDGFPRTVAQASALDRIIEERGNGPLIVVDIEVPEAELVRRLAGRLICSKCGENASPDDGDACRRCGGQLIQRIDDSEAVVRDRLKVYHQATEPLVGYYRGRPTFRVVNGAQAADVVARELDATIHDAASEGARATDRQKAAGQ